jgi:hypothetical protein
LNTVTNNTVTNSNTSNDADKAGIAVANPQGAGTVEIAYNTLSGNYNGLSVRANAAAVVAVTAHHNNLLGNTNAGFALNAPIAVNAQQNYWNSPDGPNGAGADGVIYGASVGTGTVDSSNWLTAPNPASSVADWTQF